MTRFLLINLFLIIGCNSFETSIDDAGIKKVDATYHDSSMAVKPLSPGGCYRWAVKRDTAKMRLEIKGNKVTGNLDYDWFEKDRNAGTLTGIIKDDLIIADYTFQAEGITSVRQVVFKIKDTALAEGHGDYDTGSDTLRFKDIGQLKFQGDRAFKKVDCNPE